MKGPVNYKYKVCTHGRDTMVRIVLVCMSSHDTANSGMTCCVLRAQFLTRKYSQPIRLLLGSAHAVIGTTAAAPPCMVPVHVHVAKK